MPKGKFDEALTIARQYFTELPGLMMQFADALVAAGAGKRAAAFLTEQTKERHGEGYANWLAQYHSKYEDWQRLVFTQHPSPETYKELHAISQKVGVWEPTRAEALKALEDGKHFGVLIEIALYEEDVARALELVPRLKESDWGYNYKEHVARRRRKKTTRKMPSGCIKNWQRRPSQDASALLTRLPPTTFST